MEVSYVCLDFQLYLICFPNNTTTSLSFAEPDATATLFNADAHVNSFNKTCIGLGFDTPLDLFMCQVADSTALNPCIARKMGYPHVACRNHALNLGLQDMEKDDSELKRLSDETQECHRTIKASNKLSAALSNVQNTAHEIKLKLKAATRWNSITDMFNSHLKASDEIRKVAQEFDDKIDDTTVTNSYLKKLEKHTKYLNVAKNLSCECQTKAATLSQCQDACDLLGELASGGRGKKGDDFEHCTLSGFKFTVGNPYDSGELLLFL